MMLGGFGMGFFTSLGTPAGDDIIGIVATMPLEWDADVSNGGPPPGINPYSLAHIGFGTPQTAVDTGGNPLDPAYGDARSKWYLVAGSVAVPNAPGIYTVEWRPGQNTVGGIRLGVDLNNDITDGYVGAGSLTHTIVGDTFSFTVVPEPVALSLLLLGGAGFARRRR
jgi:hypothetical protein